MTRLEQLTQRASAPTSEPEKEHLIIAGPCSAETRAQVLETAHALRDSGISYFRAGIWKPRTSPDSFEGVGGEALAWLRDVRQETGLRTAVEVANAGHVELALEHDMDLLWIGARSSVNPFTVQEIADALKGVDKPVMVKNPINPDLGLWKGALERVLRADVAEVMACHRGFDVYGKSLLRNAPLWELPIELKRQYPELTMVCDPSHIAGKRAYIEDIARKALNLGYEGLMVETHPRPDQAWSDAAQQLTPSDFLEMLTRLRFRRHHADDQRFKEAMGLLRDAIDEVDARLVELLAERMDLARRIGEMKEANNVAFYQHNRWNEIIEHLKSSSERLGMNEEFVMKLFSLIHMESIDIQGE